MPARPVCAQGFGPNQTPYSALDSVENRQPGKDDSLVNASGTLNYSPDKENLIQGHNIPLAESGPLVFEKESVIGNRFVPLPAGTVIPDAVTMKDPLLAVSSSCWSESFGTLQEQGSGNGDCAALAPMSNQQKEILLLLNSDAHGCLGSGELEKSMHTFDKDYVNQKSTDETRLHLSRCKFTEENQKTTELSQYSPSFSAMVSTIANSEIYDGVDSAASVTEDMRRGSNSLVTTRVAVLDLLQGLRLAASGSSNLSPALTSSFLSHWRSVSTAKSIHQLEPYLAAFSGSIVGDPSMPFTQERCIAILEELDNICSPVNSKRSEESEHGTRFSCLTAPQSTSPSSLVSISANDFCKQTIDCVNKGPESLQGQQILYSQVLRSIWQRWKHGSNCETMGDSWLEYHQRKILDASCSSDLFLYQIIVNKVVTDAILSSSTLLEETSINAQFPLVSPLSLVRLIGNQTVHAVASALQHLFLSVGVQRSLPPCATNQEAFLPSAASDSLASREHSNWTTHTRVDSESALLNSSKSVISCTSQSPISSQAISIGASDLEGQFGEVDPPYAQSESGDKRYGPRAREDRKTSNCRGPVGATMGQVQSLLRVLALPAVVSSDFQDKSCFVDPLRNAHRESQDSHVYQTTPQNPYDCPNAPEESQVYPPRNQPNQGPGQSVQCQPRISDELLAAAAALVDGNHICENEIAVQPKNSCWQKDALTEMSQSELHKLLLSLARTPLLSGALGSVGCAQPATHSDPNAPPSAGYPNVSFDATHNRWIAFWRLNGKNHSKSFNCAKYGGREEARQRAVEFRKQIELRFFWNVQNNHAASLKHPGVACLSSSPHRGDTCVPYPSLGSVSSSETSSSLSDLPTVLKKCAPAGVANSGYPNASLTPAAVGKTVLGLDDRSLSAVHRLISCAAQWKRAQKEELAMAPISPVESVLLQQHQDMLIQSPHAVHMPLKSSPRCGSLGSSAPYPTEKTDTSDTGPVLLHQAKVRVSSKRGRHRRATATKKSADACANSANSAGLYATGRLPRHARPSPSCRGRARGGAVSASDPIATGADSRSSGEWTQQQHQQQRLRVVSGSITFDRSQNRFMAQWKTSDGCKHSKSFYTKNFSSLEEAQMHALRFKEGLLAERDQERSLAAALAATSVRGGTKPRGGTEDAEQIRTTTKPSSARNEECFSTGCGASTHEPQNANAPSVQGGVSSFLSGGCDETSVHQAFECILSRSVQSCLQEAGERMDDDRDLSPTAQLVGSLKAVVDATACAERDAAVRAVDDPNGQKEEPDRVEEWELPPPKRCKVKEVPDSGDCVPYLDSVQASYGHAEIAMPTLLQRPKSQKASMDGSPVASRAVGQLACPIILAASDGQVQAVNKEAPVDSRWDRKAAASIVESATRLKG